MKIGSGVKTGCTTEKKTGQDSQLKVTKRL